MSERSELTRFPHFRRQLYLDNMKPTQKERDTVAILQAIQKAREGRERAKRHVKKTATEVPIAEPHSSSVDTDEAGSGRDWSPSRDPFRQRVETIRAQVNIDRFSP